MNRTLKLLMFSDIFVLTGAGLIEPIMAIFIKENLIGGTIFSAGLASTIFLLTKCFVQLPFSRYVDKHDNKIKWLITGTVLMAIVPFIYSFAEHINIIYIAQLIQGIGSGLMYPTWLGLWSRNLDKDQESYQWTVYSTVQSIGAALSAAVGAAIAATLGFKYTFLLVGVMSMMGCGVLFMLEKRKKAKLDRIVERESMSFHLKRKIH